MHTLLLYSYTVNQKFSMPLLQKQTSAAVPIFWIRVENIQIFPQNKHFNRRSWQTFFAICLVRALRGSVRRCRCRGCNFTMWCLQTPLRGFRPPLRPSAVNCPKRISETTIKSCRFAVSVTFLGLNRYLGNDPMIFSEELLILISNFSLHAFWIGIVSLRLLEIKNKKLLCFFLSVRLSSRARARIDRLI